jgi:hypothetical protein
MNLTATHFSLHFAWYEILRKKVTSLTMLIDQSNNFITNCEQIQTLALIRNVSHKLHHSLQFQLMTMSPLLNVKFRSTVACHHNHCCCNYRVFSLTRKDCDWLKANLIFREDESRWRLVSFSAVVAQVSSWQWQWQLCISVILAKRRRRFAVYSLCHLLSRN